MNLPILVVSAALLFPAPARAQGKTAEVPDVLVTVEGTPIRREDVAKRIWTQYASTGLNQIVDEMAVNKALAARRAKETKKEKESVAAAVESRLKRIKSQFKDEEAFQQSLKKSGTGVAALETEIRDQVERERLIVAANNLSVTAAEIRDFYDSNKGKLGGPPTLRLRHILVADLKRAKDLLISLKAGADFAKLAEKTTLDASTKDKGGDLGLVTAANVPPDIQRLIFGLKVAEVSEAIRMPDGVHIFKVDERIEAKDPPFEQAQTDLADAILGHKISVAWPGYVAELRAAMKIVTSPGVTVNSPAAKSAAN